jgi:predicted dinucleotide-binding enzyme
MRIGVIGAGRLGGTLATWCAESGHDVAVTSRHPDRLTGLVEHGDGHIRAMTVPQAAVFGEVLFFAPNFESAKEAIDQAHAALAGKVVIDATNPARAATAAPGTMPGEPGPGGLGAFAPGFPSTLDMPSLIRMPENTTSGFEKLIEWAPEAHWVKAFNTIPADVLDRRRGHDPLLAEYVCTDQRDAREAACRIIQELGFAPFFAGGAEAARLTETGGPLQMREVDVQDAKDVLAEALATVH